MLSIVLPTYNESENIPLMLEKIAAALVSQPYEVIVVDDNSPDETWRIARELEGRYPVRVIRRLTERGLSSAALAGFRVARGDVFCLMDSDGQHDPTLIPQLLRRVESGTDLVIGSRYMAGGSVGAWITDRRILSRIGTRMAQAVSRPDVTDPLSGLFAIRRLSLLPVLEKLRPSGFKILLEIMAHLPLQSRVSEVPLIFQMRHAGQSKLSWRVEWQFVCQVVRLALRSR